MHWQILLLLATIGICIQGINGNRLEETLKGSSEDSFKYGFQVGFIRALHVLQSRLNEGPQHVMSKFNDYIKVAKEKMGKKMSGNKHNTSPTPEPGPHGMFNGEMPPHLAPNNNLMFGMQPDPHHPQHQYPPHNPFGPPPLNMYAPSGQFGQPWEQNVQNPQTSPFGPQIHHMHQPQSSPFDPFQQPGHFKPQDPRASFGHPFGQQESQPMHNAFGGGAPPTNMDNKKVTLPDDDLSESLSESEVESGERMNALASFLKAKSREKKGGRV